MVRVTKKSVTKISPHIGGMDILDFSRRSQKCLGNWFWTFWTLRAIGSCA